MSGTGWLGEGASSDMRAGAEGRSFHTIFLQCTLPESRWNLMQDPTPRAVVFGARLH